MIHPWKYILCFIVPVTFAYNGITVNGNCSRTRPPEQFLVWGKPGLTLDCILWGTERCIGSIPPHLEGNHPASTASSLSVNGKLIADPNQNSSPQIIIEWEWEDTGSGRLKGFLVHVLTYNLKDDSSNTVCRIFDFSGITFNASGHKLKFQKKLVGFSGGSHLLYQLHLSSLPHHSPDVRLTKFFTLQPVQSGTEIPASNWIPFISYDEILFTAPATIEARFSLAPSRYGFRQYTVMLAFKNDSLNAVATCHLSVNSSYHCQHREFDPPSQNETTFLASFRDIAAGEYVIHIQPVDPYRQDDARCLCHTGANDVRQCQSCLDTSSAVFTVVANTDIANTTSSPRANTTTQIASNTDLTSTTTSSVSTTTATPATNVKNATSTSTTSSLAPTVTAKVSVAEYPNTTLRPATSAQVPVMISNGEIAVQGNCSRDFPPEPLAVWGKPRKPLVCTMWNTERCNDSLPSHLEGNDTATAPTSLSVDGVFIRDPQNNSCPQIIITWSTANNDSRIDNLKGFLLEIRKYDRMNNITSSLCRILDFSSTRFSASDDKLKFQKKLVGFPGGSHLLYQLHLTSLPHHSPDVRLTKFFTLQPVQKGTVIPASNWTPFISYDEVNFTAPATIEARFSLAPSRYGFSEYIVMLVLTGDSLNAIATCRVLTTSHYKCQDRELQPPSQNDTTVLASFSNISTGEYTIHIQPVDPYSMDDSKCLCYASVANGNRVCQGCLDTVTSTFTVVPGADITNTTIIPVSPPAALDRIGDIVASVLGVVIGVIVAGIVAVFRINRYIKVRSGKRFLEQWQKRNNNQGIKVILLNTEDHQYHTKVVSELALFLHNSCGCYVSYLPWEKGKIEPEDAGEWVLHHMDVADFIIVVNSRIAFETYEARSRDTIGHTAFNTAISHMQAKKSDDAYFQRFLFIHFAYTEEQFFIKDINPAVEYQVPEELPGLLNHIHGIQGGEEAENNIHGTLENIFEIKGLQELIMKSRKYQIANPQWFASEAIQVAACAESGDDFCSVSEPDRNLSRSFNNPDPHQTARWEVVQSHQYPFDQRYRAPPLESNIENLRPTINPTYDSSISDEAGNIVLKDFDFFPVSVNDESDILLPRDATRDIATSQLENGHAVLTADGLGQINPTVDRYRSPEFGAEASRKLGSSILPPSDIASDIATSQLENELAVLTLHSLGQMNPSFDGYASVEFGAKSSKVNGSSILAPSEVASDTATIQLDNELAVLTLHSLGPMGPTLDGYTSGEFGAKSSKVNGSSILAPSEVASDTATIQLENELAILTLHSLGQMGPTLDGYTSGEFGASSSRVNGSSILPPSEVASDTATIQLENELAVLALHSLEQMNPSFDGYTSGEFGAKSSKVNGSSILAPSEVASDTATIQLENELAVLTLHSLGPMGPTLDGYTSGEFGAKSSKVNGSSILAPSEVASDTATIQLENELAILTLHSLGQMGPTLDGYTSGEFGASSSRVNGSSILPPSEVASDTATIQLENVLANITMNSLGNINSTAIDFSCASVYHQAASK
ncbi:uncharacterized protein LOC124122768 [Haliotis rufescens]|uniref:uncharacterized protein LOC124122768 n=1 Tax=Haliotis rufescens TaxID=6454 RepID=UPI00201E7A09|nr:uncharacterized protein LOC124122768 [Haliotis rufescens]